MKVSDKRMDNIHKRCGYRNRIDVNAEGLRERLSLGWNNDVGVSLKIYSKFHIDVEIDKKDRSAKWRLTGFYASPMESQQ